eukprot:1195795-Prorocentrum_minimum.AAC.2
MSRKSVEKPDVTSFYGSSCVANNGKGALNTHRSPSPFLDPCSVPHFLPLLSPWALLTLHQSQSHTLDLAAAVTEALPYVGTMGPASDVELKPMVPSGSVEDLLAAYDRADLALPPPVTMWQWGFTKSAETWNGRIASTLSYLSKPPVAISSGYECVKGGRESHTKWGERPDREPRWVYRPAGRVKGDGESHTKGGERPDREPRWVYRPAGSGGPSPLGSRP